MDVETAKESGRTNFGQMLAYLRNNSGLCHTILVEKTDRLYRNIKDYAILDELNVEIHLVKENEIISRQSRSSEQLVHGIKVLMARNYSLNLAEETVKGMTEKARAGIYPSYAPVAYRNVDGPDGKRIIIPDPDTAPVITDLFMRFATGRYSLDGLIAELRTEGVTLRGRRLDKSTAHQIHASDCTWVSSIGMVRPTKARTNHWLRGSAGSACKNYWITAPRISRGQWSTSSLIRVLCTVVTADAFLLAS